LRASIAEHRGRALQDGGELKGSLATITQLAEAMTGLVDDLLAISVARSGQSMLRFAPVPPARLLARAAQLAGPLFEQRGLALAVNAPDDLPSIQADENRMLRVFGNLLDNALKFTDRHGSVVLAAQPVAGAVQFSIANTGSPLRDEEMERLFQPFWQAGHEDRRGAGLGLSICRSIIEAHGGSVWTEVAPGMRVKILFVLPCTALATNGLGRPVLT